MIWDANFLVLMFAIAAVSAIAYMLALWLDFLMRDQAYGPFGNAFIIVCGFFGAILRRQLLRHRSLRDRQGHRLRNGRRLRAVPAGHAGAHPVAPIGHRPTILRISAAVVPAARSAASAVSPRLFDSFLPSASRIKSWWK